MGRALHRRGMLILLVRLVNISVDIVAVLVLLSKIMGKTSKIDLYCIRNKKNYLLTGDCCGTSRTHE